MLEVDNRFLERDEILLSLLLFFVLFLIPLLFPYFVLCFSIVEQFTIMYIIICYIYIEGRYIDRYTDNRSNCK